MKRFYNLRKKYFVQMEFIFVNANLLIYRYTYIVPAIIALFMLCINTIEKPENFEKLVNFDCDWIIPGKIT